MPLTVGTPQRGRSADAAVLSTTGADQTLFAENLARNFLFIQNQSDTDMYVNFGAAASVSAGTSILLEANGGLLAFQSPGFVDVQAVHLICASASKTYCAKEA